ncbi:MAG: hypothetical protein WCK89_23925 [bacterium]
MRPTAGSTTGASGRRNCKKNYTDGGPPFKDKGYKVVSHLYNQSLKEQGGKLQAVANFKGGCPIGAENFEFEFPGTLQKNFWQTDKTMAPQPRQAELYSLRQTAGQLPMAGVGRVPDYR